MPNIFEIYPDYWLRGADAQAHPFLVYSGKMDILGHLINRFEGVEARYFDKYFWPSIFIHKFFGRRHQLRPPITWMVTLAHSDHEDVFKLAEINDSTRITDIERIDQINEILAPRDIYARVKSWTHKPFQSVPLVEEPAQPAEARRVGSPYWARAVLEEQRARRERQERDLTERRRIFTPLRQSARRMAAFDEEIYNAARTVTGRTPDVASSAEDQVRVERRPVDANSIQFDLAEWDLGTLRGAGGRVTMTPVDSGLDTSWTVPVVSDRRESED